MKCNHVLTLVHLHPIEPRLLSTYLFLSYIVSFSLSYIPSKMIFFLQKCFCQKSVYSFSFFKLRDNLHTLNFTQWCTILQVLTNMYTVTMTVYHLSKTLHTLVESCLSPCPSLGNHWSVFCVSSFPEYQVSGLLNLPSFTPWNAFEIYLFLYAFSFMIKQYFMIQMYFLWFKGASAKEHFGLFPAFRYYKYISYLYAHFGVNINFHFT